MTVDVRRLDRGRNPDRLIALMVRLVPAPEEASCFEIAVDLLRSPSRLFGPPERAGVPDASCLHTTWEELGPPMEVLERCGISVTYIRHLLHLAAHFALRNALRRDGTAVLSVFEEDSTVSLRYEMPIQADQGLALDWTLKFWDDLAAIDLLKANVLFSFVARPEVEPSAQETGHGSDPA